MGIFDTIKKGISNISKTGSGIAALNLIIPGAEVALFGKKAKESGLKSAIEQEKKVIGAKATAASIALGGVGIARSAAGGAVKAGSLEGVKQAVTKVVSNPVSLAKTAAVGTIAYGAIKTSPTLQKSIANLPQTLTKTGETIGKLVEGQPIVSETTKQSVADASVRGLVTGGLVGGAVAGGIAAVGGIGAIKDKFTASPTAKESVIVSDDPGFFASSPVYAQTQDLPKSSGTTTGTRKKRRTSKRNEGVRVSQRVNVVVSNKNQKVYKYAKYK